MHCEYGPARELIETAVASAGDEMDRNDTDTAYFNLGWISILSGNLKAAGKAFERSRRIRSEEYGEDNWRTSITISALADVHRASGEYQKAKRLSDAVWQIQTEQLSGDDLIRASTAMNRGLLLIDLGAFDEADRILADAYRVAQGKTRIPLRASIPLAQGLSVSTKGHYHRADELLQQSLAIAEEAYGPGHRMTLDYRAILGANLIKLGRLDEAESLLTETLALREKLTDVRVIDLADLLCILGELYLELDRFSDAESVVRRAQGLIEDRIANTHLIHAEIAETRGRILHSRAQFDAALECFHHALTVRGEVQSPEHPRLAKLLDAYALTLAAVGEIAKADEQRTRAEAIRKLYSEPN